MSTELTTVNARLDRLEQENVTLAADNNKISLRLQQSEGFYRRSQRRMRVQMGLALVAVTGAIFVSPANRAALAQGYGVTLATLNTRLLAVEAKTQFQSTDGTAKSTTFSGCNVIVNDGGGSTHSIVHNSVGAGLGNLIIGYNATGHLDSVYDRSPDIRTGSHNLILGDLNNYSSFGGLIAGWNNTISGNYASVSTGIFNLASGYASSVSGGYANTASGYAAAVSGGDFNLASAGSTSVSGGHSNTASGDYCSMSGGEYNIANGSACSVSGGHYNLATQTDSSVSGGDHVTQLSSYGWSGGNYHNP